MCIIKGPFFFLLGAAMEIQDLMELWDRFDSSKAEEMELDIKDVHFRLKRSAPGQSVASAMPPAAYVPSEASEVTG